LVDEILKPDRPYDPTTDADLQFFPQEQHVNTQADATPEGSSSVASGRACETR
jgi:hypothetical protein